MAPKPDLALAFGLVLAVALVVLAITTWADHHHGGQICLPGSIPITLDSVLPRHMGSGPWKHRDMGGLYLGRCRDICRSGPH
jgi:hypothetical protein